jgi:hypothetical protein
MPIERQPISPEIIDHHINRLLMIFRSLPDEDRFEIPSQSLMDTITQLRIDSAVDWWRDVSNPLKAVKR